MKFFERSLLAFLVLALLFGAAGPINVQAQDPTPWDQVFDENGNLRSDIIDLGETTETPSWMSVDLPFGQALDLEANYHRYQTADGSHVIFRTKGLPGQTLPGPFSRDNVRDIIRSPFYVGLVAHYPTRPLDMDVDVENPKRKGTQQPLRNKRQPQILQKGLHQAIYSYKLWEQNMHLRQSKGVSPVTRNRPKRDYLLTGVGKCWVCMAQAGAQASLRGSTGNTGTQYYRCATIHDKGKRSGLQSESLEITNEAGVTSSQPNTWNELIESHSSTLRADKLEAQIHDAIANLIIPPAWYEMIMAYFLSDHGMEEFERENYNLRQELKRLQDMYTSGFLTQAQFKDRALTITGELQKMQPSTKAEVREILPFLKDFSLVWEKMTSREQRTLLKVVVETVYFDEQGMVRQMLVNSPFDKLIGVAG